MGSVILRGRGASDGIGGIGGIDVIEGMVGALTLGTDGICTGGTGSSLSGLQNWARIGQFWKPPTTPNAGMTVIVEAMVILYRAVLD